MNNQNPSSLSAFVEFRNLWGHNKNIWKQQLLQKTSIFRNIALSFGTNFYNSCKFYLPHGKDYIAWCDPTNRLNSRSSKTKATMNNPYSMHLSNSGAFRGHKSQHVAGGDNFKKPASKFPITNECALVASKLTLHLGRAACQPSSRRAERRRAAMQRHRRRGGEAATRGQRPGNTCNCCCCCCGCPSCYRHRHCLPKLNLPSALWASSLTELFRADDLLCTSLHYLHCTLLLQRERERERVVMRRQQTAGRRQTAQ